MLGSLRRLVGRAVGAGDEGEGSGPGGPGASGRRAGNGNPEARIDAARERLRESIPPPDDDDLD